MYTLKVKTHFDAAHYIADYDGKCSREHGHRWEVELFLRGAELDGLNMLVDFAEVKRAAQSVLEDYLDHHQLNETLQNRNVTAEFLAKVLYDRAVLCLEVARRRGLVREDLEVGGVAVWESPDCGVLYEGEEE